MDTAADRGCAQRRVGGCFITVATAAAAWLAGCSTSETPPQPDAPALSPEPPASTAHAHVGADLAADLLGWASRLSGLENRPEVPLPALQPLPPEALAAEVCPQRPAGCRSLVAVYDTERQRILYRDTLDMRDPTDQSFLVHELVHHLQYQHQGDALFATCESTLAGETQAYRAQNRYQEHFRQWQRMGEVLRFAHCGGAADAPVAQLGPPGATAAALR